MSPRAVLRHRASVYLPAIVMAMAMAMSVGLHVVQTRGDAAQAVADAAASLRRELHHEAVGLVESLARGESLRARRAVGRLALDPDLLDAWLLDERGVVTGALTRLRIGDRREALVSDPAIARLVRAELAMPMGEGPEGLLRVRRVDAGHLVGRVQLRTPDGRGLGELVLVHDLDRPLAEAARRGEERTRRQLLVVLVAGVLMSLILELAWGRRARRLVDAADRVARGALDARAGMRGGDELAAIGAALDDAAASLARSGASSRALAEAFAHAPAVAFTLRAGDRVLEFASDSLRRWGYAPEQFLGGRRRLIELVHPDDRAEVLARTEAALDHGEPDFSHVFRVVAADGRVAWVENTLVLQHGEDGIARLHMLMLDITERREEGLRMEVAAESAGLAGWHWRREERLLRLDARWAAVLGLRGPVAWTRAQWLARVHPDERDAMDAALDAAIEGREDRLEFSARLRHDDGSWRWVQGFGGVLARDADGLPLRLAGFARDISAMRRAEHELRLAAAVFSNSEAGILVTDAAGVIETVNPAFERLTGYTRAQAVGQRPSFLSSGQHDRAFYQRMWASLLELGHWEGEVVNRRADGATWTEWLSINAVRDERGVVQHYIAHFVDISARKRVEARLDYLRGHDPLTGLDNRRRFLEHAGAMLAGVADDPAGPGQAPGLALAVIDLDRFRLVNDSLGMAAGDGVLRKLAAALQQAFPDQVLARLGADEFALLLPGGLDAAGRDALGAKVEAVVSTPCFEGGTRVVMNACVGLAQAPRDARDAAGLLAAAMAALARAKLLGAGSLAEAGEARRASREEMELEGGLADAVAQGELRLRFQPQVALEDGRLTGVEALVRWQHPTLGELSPALFIPLAERSGRIVELGGWVLEEACRAAVRLHAAGMPRVPVSVNVSAVQLRRPGFLERVRRALADSGLAPALLELELTESVLMDDASGVADTLAALRGLGLKMAIDDFGTGYSNMAYLGRLPVDRLKIDQGFVRRLDADREARAITAGIIALANSLGLGVIAEGVEHAWMVPVLRGMGCAEGQGYHFGRPLDEAALLAAWSMHHDGA